MGGIIAAVKGIVIYAVNIIVAITKKEMFQKEK